MTTNAICLEAAAGLNVVAGSVGRSEEDCAELDGAVAEWSATASVLAAKGDPAGDAKGRDIGTVEGRLSGAVTSVVEGSAPAAGSLPNFRCRGGFRSRNNVNPRCLCHVCLFVGC